MQYTKLWNGKPLAKTNVLHEEIDALIKQGFTIDQVIPYYVMSGVIQQAIIIYSKKDG